MSDPTSYRSELLSELATKIKEITGVYWHQFIRAGVDLLLLFARNSCRFDGSHLATQVDTAHKTDNRQLYNLLPDRGLEKGTWKILKIAQDNYTSSSGISEVKLEMLPVDSFGNFSCACLLDCSLMIFKSVGSIPDIDLHVFFPSLSPLD